MKLNLKESLIKMGLLTEGWMESLSDKYSEDVLIFTGRMLQQAFGDEDISNHPMAPWIAKAAKSFGNPAEWSDDKMANISDSFQKVLTFIKNSEHPEEATKEILKRNAKESLKYIEEKQKEAANKSVSAEEELKEWLDKGYMEIIGRGPRGSFWAKPLKGEFFGVAQCAPLQSGGMQSIGEFGIGCQRGPKGGFGAVGFGDYKGNTYTLLAKSKEGYYTGVISTGHDPDSDTFVYHSLQYGNQPIGSQGWESWNAQDFANAFVDFMVENPYGRRMYKEKGDRTSLNANGREVSEKTRIPNRFSSILKNHKPIFFKLLRNHPDFVEYYEKALRAELGDEFEIFTVKARELYEKDPRAFVAKLPSYLRSEPKETVRILEEINFEEFIEKYGKDVVEHNLNSILSVMDYKKFHELIEPHIDFKSFLEKTQPSELKEMLRKFSEKENSPPKFLKILNSLIKQNGDYILNKLGDGNYKAGFVKLVDFLKTPRLTKHQNYRIKDGKLIATVQEKKRNENGRLIDHQGRVIMDENGVYDINGVELNFDNQEDKEDYVNSRVQMINVDKLVKDSHYVLDLSSIRKFLKSNKDLYSRIFGDDEKAEINFIRHLLRNSNEKTREQELRSEKERLISYYDKEYKEGRGKEPGFIVYSELIHPTPSAYAEGSKILPGIKLFSVDKKDFKEYYKDILKYFYGKIQEIQRAEGQKIDSDLKANAPLYGLIQVADSSGFHEDYIKKTLVPSFLKNVEGQGGIKALVNFVEKYLYGDYGYSKEEVLDILNREDIKRTQYYRAFVEKFEKLEKEREYVANIEKHVEEGYNKFKLQLNRGLWVGDGEEGKRMFLYQVKQDGYRGRTVFHDGTKSIIYHPKSEMIKDKRPGDLSEQKVRKYVRNLLESSYKKKKSLNESDDEDVIHTDIHGKKSSPVDYTAIVIEDESEIKKIELELSKMGLSIPEGWKKPGDYHMTITKGELSLGAKMAGAIGKEVKLTIETLGVSQDAIALGTVGYFSRNKVAHITVAYKTQAMDSNNIEYWKPIEPFIVTGYVREIEHPYGFGKIHQIEP